MIRKLLFTFTALMCSSAMAADNVVPAVVVEEVKLTEIAPQFSTVGRVQAKETVSLVARVSGLLEKKSFVEGSTVEKGQLLFSIEQAPYQIQVDQSKADLAGVKAGLKQAQADLDRSKQLNRKGALSKSQLEIAEAKRDQAAAQVMQAKAGLRKAELDLSYTQIKSPISGRISKTTYSEGNLVNPNSKALATVVSMDPIKVEIAVSEKLFIDVRKNGMQMSPAPVVPRLVLSDGSVYEQAGEFDFIDPTVDTKTDTIKVRATFANPKGILLPGEFVRVFIQERVPQQGLLISQAAVQRNKEGFFVMKVVTENGKQIVKKAAVEMGEQYDSQWIVQSGLNAGDKIIIEGLQKVQPDIEVTAVDKPTAEKE